MEQEPKFKLGQKVWFVAENENVCYGIISVITPVNYTFNYSIKMNLHSIGEVTKNIVWEDDILGDFDDDIVDIISYATNHGAEKELDKLILERLFSLGLLNRKKERCTDNPVSDTKRFELTPEQIKEMEDSMYDENGWMNLGGGLKKDKQGRIAGGLKPSNYNPIRYKE